MENNLESYLSVKDTLGIHYDIWKNELDKGSKKELFDLGSFESNELVKKIIRSSISNDNWSSVSVISKGPHYFNLSKGLSNLINREYVKSTSDGVVSPTKTLICYIKDCAINNTLDIYK